MKVIFIHKPTGFYVGGSVFNKTCGFYKCRDKMIEKGISEDKANMLIDIIGPYLCVWEIKDGDDPYDQYQRDADRRGPGGVFREIQAETGQYHALWYG